MLRYEVIVQPESLKLLREEWDRLYQAAPQAYFAQSFTWCWNSWLHMARSRDRRIVCLAVWDDNKLVMTFPFVVERRLGFVMAKPLGPQTTDYADVLMADNVDVEVLVSAWKLLCDSCQCDIFSFSYVRSTGPLAELLTSIAEQRRWRVIVTGKSVIKSINWMPWANWQSYYMNLDRKQRRDIARRRRRLEEKGSVEFHAAVASADSGEVIDWIFDYKQRWQKRRNLPPNTVTLPEYRRFLKTVALQSALHAGLIVSTLKVNGMTIAGALSRVNKAGFEALMTTYDPAWHMYAPSHCLYEGLLKWAFERKLNVDLRLGDEEFKNYYNVVTETTTNYAVTNSLRGRLFPVALRVRDMWTHRRLAPEH